MEKKFLSKAKFYRCTELSWWNDGTERKPSKRDFDNLQFEEVSNPNMKWISLFNIELTVPSEYEFNFFKLEHTVPNSNLPTVEYYYVEQVLDINSKNKKLLLTVDIWCSYIIQDLSVPQNEQINKIDIETNRWLPDDTADTNAHLSPMKQIPPFGFLSDSIQHETVDLYEDEVSLEDGLWNNSLVDYSSTPVFGDWDYDPSGKINVLGKHKYYAFAYSYPSKVTNVDKNTPYRLAVMRTIVNGSSMSGVLLIPVLFDSVGCYTNSKYNRNIPGGLNEDLGFYSESIKSSAWSFVPNQNYPLPTDPLFNKDHFRFFLFNDETNLIRFAERIKEHQEWTGINKFLGVHYGENYFTLINKYNEIDDKFESNESIETKWNNAVFSKDIARNIYNIKADNFLPTGWRFRQPDNLKAFGFACVKVPPSGIEILNTDKFDFAADKKVLMNAKNLHYLADPDYIHNIGNKKLYFTDRMVLSNVLSAKEYNSEVPLMLDDYYNVLQATKPQRDATLRAAIGNFISSGVNNWVNPAIHGNGVFSEKTAWGNYWNSTAENLGYKSMLNIKQNLQPADWIVGKKTSPMKPWANLDALLSARKDWTTGTALREVGASDLKMGKISQGLGLLSSLGSILNSSIQLSNTINGLNAQQQSIRLQTATNITSTSSAFIKQKSLIDITNSKNLIQEWNTAETIKENRKRIHKSWMTDYYIGTPTVDLYNSLKYYGVEMLYTPTITKIEDITNGWIVMSNGEMLYRKLYQSHKHILRQEVLEAIVKMLTQGVRVMPK